MGKIIERCAGIDVGKRFLLCCVLTEAAHEEPRSKTLRFDTTVPALEGLHKWLRRKESRTLSWRVRDPTGFQSSIFWKTSSWSSWLTRRKSRIGRGTKRIAKIVNVNRSFSVNWFAEASVHRNAHFAAGGI
jgi:hypothetical protein